MGKGKQLLNPVSLGAAEMEEESPLCPTGSVSLLHVDAYISHYSGPSSGAADVGTSAVALYDYQGGKFEAT